MRNESRIAASSSMTRMRDLGMSRFHYKSQKRVLIQRFDAKLTRLLQFGAGVSTKDHVVGFLTNRCRDARAELFECLGGLFAAHRRQGAGQHEHAPGQRAY